MQPSHAVNYNNNNKAAARKTPGSLPTGCANELQKWLAHMVARDIRQTYAAASIEHWSVDASPSGGFISVSSAAGWVVVYECLRRGGCRCSSERGLGGLNQVRLLKVPWIPEITRWCASFVG